MSMSRPEVPVSAPGLDWPSPEADYLRVQVSVILPLFRNTSGVLVLNYVSGQVIFFLNIPIRPCL